MNTIPADESCTPDCADRQPPNCLQEHNKTALYEQQAIVFSCEKRDYSSPTGQTDSHLRDQSVTRMGEPSESFWPLSVGLARSEFKPWIQLGRSYCPRAKAFSGQASRQGMAHPWQGLKSSGGRPDGRLPSINTARSRTRHKGRNAKAGSICALSLEFLPAR